MCYEPPPQSLAALLWRISLAIKAFQWRTVLPQQIFPCRCSHQLTNELVANREGLQLFLISTIPAVSLFVRKKRKDCHNSNPQLRFPKKSLKHLTLAWFFHKLGAHLWIPAYDTLCFGTQIWLYNCADDCSSRGVFACTISAQSLFCYPYNLIVELHWSIDYNLLAYGWSLYAS